MRKKVIAANWKMYKTPDQSRDFFRDFLPLVAGHDRDEIVVCPPFVDLYVAVAAARLERGDRRARRSLGKRRRLHRRNFHRHVAALAGATHVIIGHSERRQYFNETDDTVNRSSNCPGSRADSYRLCRRSSGRARGGPDRGRVAPSMPAGL